MLPPRKKRVITVNLGGKDLSKTPGQPQKAQSQPELDLKGLEKLARMRGTTLAQEIAKVVQGMMDGKK